MAMLLPIMVGLQTAVAVSELEQGDYAVLDNAGSEPLMELKERMSFKWPPGLESCGEVSIGSDKFYLDQESFSLLSAEEKRSDANWNNKCSEDNVVSQ